MRILIFESDMHDFKQLRHLLEDIDPEYEIMGPMPTVEYGRYHLTTHKDYDLIIADVQLSDGLSFDALDQAPDDVPVIFYAPDGDHALRAFGYNSLSYLLKPIDGTELAVAIEKSKRLMRQTAGGKHRAKGGGRVRAKDSAGYRERFMVKTLKGERIVLVMNIYYICSENKTTYIRLLDGNSFSVEMSLDKIDSQMNPDAFMRVNRKYIVPKEQVDYIEKRENGKELLYLKGASTPQIRISRDKKNELHKWIGGGSR